MKKLFILCVLSLSISALAGTNVTLKPSCSEEIKQAQADLDSLNREQINKVFERENEIVDLCSQEVGSDETASEYASRELANECPEVGKFGPGASGSAELLSCKLKVFKTALELISVGPN